MAEHTATANAWPANSTAADQIPPGRKRLGWVLLIAATLVLLAAIVNGTVREPIENKTAGSSAGRTLFDANAILSEPLTGFGCADDNDNPTGTC